MNTPKLLAAAAAMLMVAGCTSAPPVTAPPPPPQPSFVPYAPEPSPTPAVVVTTIAAEGPLACRKATAKERSLIDVPVISSAAVDIGSGWLILAYVPAVDTKSVYSLVMNGERYNHTYAKESAGSVFTYRALPIAFTDGFAAIELAESCARKGHA